MTRTHKVMIFSFIFFILGLLFAAVIWLRRQNLDIAQTPEHMIEIRVENNTDEPFENMKFGILDADNTLLYRNVPGVYDMGLFRSAARYFR